nr:solute carrier family 2, facilitated glucose transporter member 6-like [Danaus plexippus plexippus]
MSPMTLLLQSQESPKGVPLTDLETIWLLKLCSMNIWVFILARMLVGINMSGTCVTCPTYIKEISDNDIRGALGCWGTLFFTMGCLFSYIIGDLCSYRVILLILLTIPALHFVIFLTMPESPSYLLKKGKDEEASKVLMWLRCRKQYDFSIKEEMDYIKQEQQKDENQTAFLLKNIWKDNILRRAFYIALIAAMARELCGSVPILIFAGDIFKMSSEGTGIVMSPNQNAMVLGAVQLLGATLVSAIVERFGRKAK